MKGNELAHPSFHAKLASQGGYGSQQKQKPIVYR